MMLRISEKKTTSVDLYGPIREYITFNYSGREADKHDKDLWTLKNLRYQLENPAEQPAPSSRRETLLSYYRSLCVVETLFPISPAKGHINSVTFTWYDAFKKGILKVGNKASQQSIHLEKAAVLFNLGAVYNEIGRSYNRSTAEGRLDAVQAFISAAGVFAYLKDNAALKASMGGPATVDVSVECARMLERLMLAQAQECVFDNAIAKGSTPGVCAKISRQVGLYYEEALSALKVEPLAGRIDKNWISHVQLKAAFFNAEACYRYGLELHEKDEVGEEIARLNNGISTLKEAKKSSKLGSAELVSAIEKLKASIETDLGKALQANDVIYYQRVPSPDSLPSLPSLSMVKPMPMNEVLDARDEKMFSGLAQCVPVGSESNVYGQSASNLVAGSSWEGAIQEMLEIGGGTWDRDTVVHALRVHGNLERAVEYLCPFPGIPKQPEVPPVTQVPSGAQAANPPAQPAQPAQSAPRHLPSAVPQAVTITPEERVAIKRLEALGFDRAIAQEEYFAWDKNEELAANKLLDRKPEYKD